MAKKNDKKKRKRTEWTPFEECVWPGDPALLGKNGRVYRNSRYQVVVADASPVPFDCSLCRGTGLEPEPDPEYRDTNPCPACGGKGGVEASIKHLSIKRLSKGGVHDWRELQRIKNELTDPECEAVELYPAESRLIDDANQYHLWVFPKGMKLPLGHHGVRRISTGSVEIEGEMTGQRARKAE